MGSILQYKFKLLHRTIIQRGIESKIKLFIGLLVVSIFTTGSFFLFYFIFKHIKNVQDIGPILADKLLSVGFMAFAFMLLISNLVSGISTLFKSVETHFLISSPISHRNTFWIKFIDNIFFSSWATIMIGIPLFISYSIVFQLEWYYVLLSTVLGLPAFLIIPACLGVFISILFYIISHSIGFRKTLYIGIAVSIGFIVLYMRENQLSSILFSVQGDINILNFYLSNLATSGSSVSMPWDWLAGLFKFARWGEFGRFGLYLSMLLSSAAFFLMTLDFGVEGLYYKAFLAASESLGVRKKQKEFVPKKLFGSLWQFFSPFPRDMRSILVKDVKLFFRDPSQWTQFGVLLVLLGVYLVNLRNVPSRINSESLQLSISFANYGFCGYILATLSVRFVYPSISMEGRSFWLIRSSPINVSRIFWEKFALAFGIFFVIAEFVAVVSNAILAQQLFMMLLTGGGIFLMSISLVSLSVGMGILFPDFEEANPGKIASSGGGMFTALLSLIFVALSVVILAWPTSAYIRHLTLKAPFPKFQIVTGGILLLVLNAITTYIPLSLGVKAIKKLEH